MGKLLSISIATYNSALVINECLDSIVKSKYIDLIEVLVIDDGSKDNTRDIVQTYVKKYPKSVFLVKKDNGVQAIYGPKADVLKSDINDIL